MLDLEGLKKIVEERGRVNAVFTYADGRNVTRRLTISTQGNVMVMGKGARRWGYILQDKMQGVISIRLQEKKVIPPAVKWRKSWEKVLARLEKSGFWADMAEDVRVALSIGYDTLQAASVAYWDDGLNDDRMGEVKRVQAVEPRLIGENGDGKPYVRTSILWYMSKVAKVKKMYFGKWDNPRCFQEIEHAITNGVKSEVFGFSSYDVNFCYDPEKKKAWYSEEYRGCGNGHYYLALDATHALFYEDY